jgi:hypothetical protein
MHPGSQQDQRLSPALVPGYFRPDELSLAQRLRQTLELARNLRFVSSHGTESGHWGQTLEQDLSLLLAELAALPLDDWEAQADQFAWLAPARALAQCLELARQLNRWHVLLDVDTPVEEQALRDVLRQPFTRALRESLGLQLRDALIALDAPDLAWSGWHPDWRIERPLAGASAAMEPEPAAAQLRRLRLLWLAMCRLLRLLQVLAAQQLPASLGTGQHDPGTGLLLAWTQLLQHTRDTLNQFDTRLTLLYYAERLGFRMRPAQPDRVHLVLERDPRHPKPVWLPEGWRFVANLERGSCSYAAEHALYLSPLRVSQLLSLRHEFDPQISPEREYRLATQALARRWIAVPTTEQAADTRAPSVPLLGGGAGSAAARQGIAIASPLLGLREGERTIDVVLMVTGHEGLNVALPPPDEADALEAWGLRLAAHEQAEWPEAAGAVSSVLLAPDWVATAGSLLQACPGLRDTPWLAYLLLRCLASSVPATLTTRLGRLFAAWLCTTGPELDPAACARLRQHARQVLAETSHVDVDDPLSLLFGDAPLERRLVFDRVFRGAWRAELSVAEGWLDLGEAFVSRVDTPDGSGLSIGLALSPDQPAVVPASPLVHGAGWPALPVLQLRLHDRSRLFASSLLQQLRLEAAELTVSVRGARCLQVHNQLGRLDPSKPFMPLGPLPDSSAYLVFTHAELASKPLEHLQLNLQWSGLPPRGLATHYAGYPGDAWTEPDFRVQLSLLSDGRWQEANGPSLPLFARRGESTQQLELDGAELLRLHHPVLLPEAPPGQPAPAPEFGLASRQGFFRLQLVSPDDAFGHALYPRVMAETLTHNSRVKPERARPLPLAPYTPVLESMTVDYTSRQRLTPRVNAEQARQGEMLHITPFGLQALRRLPQACPVHVLQRWAGAGQLFIGLDGPAAEGSLSLLFRLRSEAAREALGRPRPRLQWHAWRGDDWWALEPHRVLLDTTEGLLRSGLVMLDLPNGMTRGCTSLPGDCFWLRLSGEGELDLLAGLIGVWTNGVSAQRLGDCSDEPLPPGRIRAALEATPGLATVRQPWPSFDLQAQESAAAWTTRVAERLRHRARALTPWDCERLVLQAFPEVFKLKCIPRSDTGPDEPVLVVVVPALPAGYEIDGTEAPRLDASTLQRIAQYLGDRMPPGQALLVRNASYERIQVRCTLRLARGEPTGERLRELNQSLRDYLSPWRPGGITTQFDWQLRADEVEAFLRAQPGVDTIGRVSLLHIVSSDQAVYRLSDTARGDRVVRPAQAWSLALPTRGHLLELADQPTPLPQPSGLGKLTVGSSFIIGRDAA